MLKLFKSENRPCRIHRCLVDTNEVIKICVDHMKKRKIIHAWKFVKTPGNIMEFCHNGKVEALLAECY